jgi:TonB family protein
MKTVSYSLFFTVLLHFVLAFLLFFSVNPQINFSKNDFMQFNLQGESAKKASNFDFVKKSQISQEKSQSQSEAKFESEFLSNEYPKYPALAKRRKEQGQVILRATIDENGAPKKVEIAKSSSFKTLDFAAIEAVKKWQFIPAEKFGQKLVSTILIPITFKLENYDN